MDEIPRCEQCGALVRPHICWFGEVPFEMELVLHQLGEATVLMTIGSSGVVEPAASFVRIARRNGARTIYVGPEEPVNLAFFDEVVQGKAGEEMPRMVTELLNE
jgi:NAD-dependent deacetylase